MVATPKHVSQTDEHIHEEICRRTEMNIAYYSAHTEEIEDRLAELDAEWDVERVLEASAAGVSLLGFTLGRIRSRIWYLLPPVVAGFLFQHAIQGWCPALPLVRRMGVRTAREIETERHALKLLRGDFGEVVQTESGQRPNASEVMEAVR